MKNKAKFITIEGCEGVGKSTQLALLKQYFAQHNIDAVFTREPGGTKISEVVRDIILNPDFKEMDDITELLLYQAARRQHVAQIIVPALNAGKIVVCDRFIHSTMAYQGYGRGLDLKLINRLNESALQGLKIDLCIFIDVSPKEGFERKGGAGQDRLELQDYEFHLRVYDGFKKLAALDECVKAIPSADRLSTHNAIIQLLKDKGVIN